MGLGLTHLQPLVRVKVVVVPLDPMLEHVDHPQPDWSHHVVAEELRLGRCDVVWHRHREARLCSSTDTDADLLCRGRKTLVDWYVLAHYTRIKRCVPAAAAEAAAAR